MNSDRAARVVVPVRLPESFVERLDALRGSRTRSAWLRGFIEEVVAQKERLAAARLAGLRAAR